MTNFEDIARDRVLQSTIEEIPDGLNLDPNDVEIFASMVYAILRAGARREGQEGFQRAFTHFMGEFGSRNQLSETDVNNSALAREHGVTDNYSRDAELESIRLALIGAVERFASEARALHVYFNAIDNNGVTKEAATQMAIDVLEEDLGNSML